MWEEPPRLTTQLVTLMSGLVHRAAGGPHCKTQSMHFKPKPSILGERDSRKQGRGEGCSLSTLLHSPRLRRRLREGSV